MLICKELMSMRSQFRFSVLAHFLVSSKFSFSISSKQPNNASSLWSECHKFIFILFIKKSYKK